MTNLKITPAIRAALRQVLANSAKYDDSTMRISRDGLVSAKHDADKTCAGNDDRRYSIAHVNEMVGQDGSIREGWQ